MGVRKDETNGKWLMEAYQGKQRIRKWFDTKAEANAFYNLLKEAAGRSPLLRVGVPQGEGMRFRELAKLWFNLHGKTLVGGDARYRKLLWIAEVLGDPLARDFNAEMFADYRAKRLSGEILCRGCSVVPKESLLNREQAIVRAMFNELKRLGKWKGGNPIAAVRKFREREREIAFLRADEIDRLLVACDESRNPHLRLIVRLCLATGARWSEVQDLTASQVIPYKVTFTETKNGKNRTIPISPDLFELIPKVQGRLFKGAYYRACYRAFNFALKRAGVNLPKGQATHVLRHTFASHFMMNGGNILVLRDILGHSDIKMTMRYAHFAPSYLEQAVMFNPLNRRG